MKRLGFPVSPLRYTQSPLSRTGTALFEPAHGDGLDPLSPCPPHTPAGQKQGQFQRPAPTTDSASSCLLGRDSVTSARSIPNRPARLLCAAVNASQKQASHLKQGRALPLPRLGYWAPREAFRCLLLSPVAPDPAGWLGSPLDKLWPRHLPSWKVLCSCHMHISMGLSGSLVWVSNSAPPLPIAIPVRPT